MPLVSPLMPVPTASIKYRNEACDIKLGGHLFVEPELTNKNIYVLWHLARIAKFCNGST